MDMSFSSEQDLLRKSVAEFLAKECDFDMVRELEESDKGYSPAMWKQMAQLGWMETALPEGFGGFGDPFTDVVIILEEIGKTSFAGPFFSTVIQCGGIIAEAGSEAQKKEILPLVAQGKLLMAQALYEDEPSYLPGGITLPATDTGDGFELTGVKMFVIDANIADKMLVAALVKGTAPTFFLVDAKELGIYVEKLPAIGKDNICRVVFDKVRASKKDIVGEIGKADEILHKVSDKAIVALCAQMMGGAKAAIDMTAEYAKGRQQYGKPIGGFQAIQHYMANMLTAYEIPRNYLYKLAWMIDQGQDVSAQTPILKAKVNEAYKFISERGVQIHGGVGTTREFNIGLFYRRAKASEFVLGDTDHHIELVAQNLGL